MTQRRAAFAQYRCNSRELRSAEIKISSFKYVTVNRASVCEALITAVNEPESAKQSQKVCAGVHYTSWDLSSPVV